MKLLYNGTRITRCHIGGLAFDKDDRLLEGNSLVSYLSSATDFSDFGLRCSKLNGSWHAVLLSCGFAYLAVDHRATLALYYRIVGNELRVSDNGFDLLLPEESSVQPAPKVELYFSRWGFTPKHLTLHPDIYRLEAGTAIQISLTTPHIRVVTHSPNFTFLPDLAQISYQQAKELVRERLNKAMQRMARVVGDRPVVLPLTAGRDSRMIAIGLKQNGIEHSQCISYGRDRKIEDCSTAHRVASDLDFHHRFISSLPPTYGTTGYTEDRSALRFLRYVSGLGSGYFFAEYLPAMKLAEEFGEQRRPIILPGHNGDIAGGDNLRYPLFRHKRDLDRMASFLTEHEDGNRTLSRPEKKLLKAQIREILDSYPSNLSMAAYFETFRNKEISTKYYINSARAWRYFGLPVWMPFLDREFIDLMHNLPLEYRWGKRIYEEVTDEYYKQNGVCYPTDKHTFSEIGKPLSRLKTYLRPYLRAYLSRRDRLWLNDAIGFKTLMEGSVLQQVQANCNYRPTTANGLSFAWWLLSLKNGQALL